jgi:hypothetical protein
VWTNQARYWYDPGLVFIAPDGEMIRTFRTRRQEVDLRSTIDRYLSEQSTGG